MKSILARWGLLLFLAAAAAESRATVFDAIQFGESGSETSHAFEDGGSEAVRGALGEPARIPKPSDPASWRGGGMKFNLRVHPQRRNYVTFKLWGGDVNENMLILLAGGRQLGYRFFGDVDIPDRGGSEPASPGRFYYVTLPLPVSATYRRDRLEFELYPAGPVWLPGRNLAQFQKEMKSPGRGVYRMIVHDDPFFVPPEEEASPAAPVPVAAASHPESFDAVKSRVNRELESLLAAEGGAAGQDGLRLLARAYRVPWSAAFRREAAVRKVVEGVDELFRRRRENPGLAGDDRSCEFPELTGFGPAAEAVVLLQGELAPLLKQEIPDGNGRNLVRRKAWSELFAAGVRHLSGSRQPWPERSMIVDCNLHWNNRALKLLEPSRGLPLETTLGFLRESVGLEPWSGPADAKGNPSLPPDGRTMLFTAKGLPLEFGYDGGRGERILGLAARIYEATRPEPGAPGDERILGALRKMLAARGVFRYPALDAALNPVMRLETAIGWRDTEFPGPVTYAQRPDADNSPLEAAASALDPGSTGAVRQMLAERQYFPAVAKMLEADGMRPAAALLGEPERFALLSSRPASAELLPMSGKKDFVWSDEEAGVVAVKDGADILYASLYWRAPSGVNFLAKVHFLTPEFERIATVREEVDFKPSGLTVLRPGWTTFGSGSGGLNYPDKVFSLHSGETLPVAAMPKVPNFTPGQEHPQAGRGDFCRLAYGPYLIGMNMGSAAPHPLVVPEKRRFRRLPGGKEVKPGETIQVEPGTTVVLKWISGK